MAAKARTAKLLETLDELLAMLMPADGAPLTEERICQLCNDCLQSKAPQPLIRALGEAFTQPAILARCFQGKPDQDRSASGSNTGWWLKINWSFLTIVSTKPFKSQCICFHNKSFITVVRQLPYIKVNFYGICVLGLQKSMVVTC